MFNTCVESLQFRLLVTVLDILDYRKFIICRNCSMMYVLYCLSNVAGNGCIRNDVVGRVVTGSEV